MNAEIKKQMDERLIEGAMSPDEYLAGVRAHRDKAAASDAGTTGRPIFTSAKRTRPSMKQWQWGVLIPVVLIFSSLFAEPPALPKGYVATGGGQSEVAADAKPKTLRDYYTSPVKQPDIFSMPDPRTMPRNPGQSGQPQISPEDAYALGIAMSPLVQAQQEMMAQQQEAARQKQQAQQLKKQQDAQRALEFAQRFQNMGVPHWARPPAGQQQPAPSNIQPAPTGGPCSYACDTCRLIQTYSSRREIMPRCPRDGGSMRLMR